MAILYGLVLALATPAADPASVRGHGANPVYQEVLKGVTLSPKDKVPLPGSFMPDGLTAKQQRKVLDDLCVGGDPKKPLFRYADAIEPGTEVPYFFDQREIKTSDANAPAWLVDGWFVTYGDLKALAKKDPQQIFSANPGKADPVVLTEKELAERKITLDLEPPLRERLVHTEASLIDRIEVGMTSRLVGSFTDESIVIASQVDQRFANDETYGNWWRTLPDLDEREGKPGPKKPLEGGGYYVKVTQLQEPRNALFVEFHQVNTEPRAWFNGAPILRGKVNIWIREEVKRFRLVARKTLP